MPIRTKCCVCSAALIQCIQPHFEFAQSKDTRNGQTSTNPLVVIKNYILDSCHNLLKGVSSIQPTIPLQLKRKNVILNLGKDTS